MTVNVLAEILKDVCKLINALLKRILRESFSCNVILEFTNWGNSKWNFHKNHEDSKSEDNFIAHASYIPNRHFNETDLPFVFTDSDYNKNDPYDKRNFTKYSEQLIYFASNTKSYA